MPWILMKNNLKLMLRNKWSMILILIISVLTSAVLINAFKEFMSIYTPADTILVGYRMKDQSMWESTIDIAKKLGEESKIVFVEYSDGNIDKALSEEKFLVFAEFDNHGYTIYKTNEHNTSAITLEYFLYKMIGSMYQKDINLPVAKVKTETLKTIPKADSTQYYSIIYIVYFSWCGIVVMSSVFTSEKKNRIVPRYHVSPILRVKLYLGKVIPCTLIIALLTLSSAIISTMLFSLHWENLLMTVIIMLLNVCTASCMGIFLYYIFQNIAVTIGSVFIIVWVWGLWGGTFETYMYSSIPQYIKELSPLYYVNRTLIEYRTMGESAYEGRCIIVLLIMIITFFIGGMLLSLRRKGDFS